MNTESRVSRGGPRAATALAGLLIAGLLIAGCGSDDGSDVPPRPEGITDEQGKTVELRTSRDQLHQKLGEDNIVLTSVPQKDAPGGCEYYAMQGRPLVNVWQYCFDDKDEVKQIATQYGVNAEPPDASPGHIAMVGRGDGFCQAANRDFNGVTDDVGKALTAFGNQPNAANRDEVAAQLEKFAGVLDELAKELSVFEAPEDGKDALDGYMASLESQADTLTKARAAFLDGDLNAYNKLGDQFTEIGDQAKEQAKEYGFVICSAPSFG